VVAAWLSLSPAWAVASPAGETRYLDEQARELFQTRRYEDALQRFLWVLRVTPSASAAYNVALSAERAGDEVLSFSSLQDYFQLAPQSHPTFLAAVELKHRLSKRLALVEVVSTPPGATIFVDRKDLGAYGTTPTTIAVVPGEHRLILQSPDHLEGEISIVAQSGESFTVTSELDPALVSVKLETNVADAHFFVTVRGETWERPTGTHRLPRGFWTVRAEAEGYAPQEVQLSTSLPSKQPAPSEEQPTQIIKLRLTPVPPPYSRLLIDTGGPTAQVVVDGRPRGETPLVLRLPAGKHHIRLTSEGYLPRSIELQALPHRAHYRQLPLEPIAKRKTAPPLSRP
jgi:outer membrane receptor for ferrienterochelin and colicins